MNRTTQMIAAATAATTLMLSAPVAGVTAIAATAVMEIEDESGATLSVPENVTGGEEITLEGTGWLSSDGKRGSSIAVKLNYQEIYATDADKKYTLPDSEALMHPGNGQPDITLWAIIVAEADGTFSQQITLPKELTAGQKLTINFASGLTREFDDAQRSITTDPLIVDGTPWVPPAVEDTKCHTDLAVPTFAVASEPNPDNTLTITGQGWCNTISGGRRIAIKIDEGSISRLDQSVNSNKTIWAIIDEEVDPTTGNFTYHMPLPDGSTTGPNGSAPALKEGAHTLRFLTGSLKDGDPVGTFPAPGANNTTFIIGAYRPSGAPEPLNYSEHLGASSMSAISVDKQDDSIKVTVLGAEEGDWVYFTTYLPDGSARWPWGPEWHQVDANSQATLPLTGVTLPQGRLKLAAQNGNQGKLGELIGWEYVTLKEAAATPTSTETPSPATSTPAAATRITPEEAQKVVSVVKEAVDALSALPIVELLNITQPAPTMTAAPTTTRTSTRPTTTTRRVAAQTRKVAVTPVVEPRTNSRSTSSRVTSSFNPQRATTSSASQRGTSAPSTTAVAPQPTKAPDKPVVAQNNLNLKNSNKTKGKLSGSELVVTNPKVKRGDWVYVYNYDDTTTHGLGWAQADTAGAVSLDISHLGSSVHKFALVGADQKLIGWVGIDLTAETTETAVVAQAPLMRGLDWLLIFGGLGLVCAAAFGVRWHLNTLRKGK